MYRAPSPYGQPQPPRPYSPHPPTQRAYSPQPPTQRAYSPQPPTQRAYSPQPPAQPYPSYQAKPQPHALGEQIIPGTVIYTTSTAPDGRIIYHSFKAVAASYQTTSGIVSGIQWIPEEATHVIPQGAQPAPSDFAGTWNRSYGKEDKLKEWQREEDKRRKREEKESAKRLREQEYRNDEREYERERRKSFNAGVPPTLVNFPSQGPASTGRPTSPYQPYAESVTTPYGTSGPNTYGRERKYSNAGGYETLNRQFDEMDLNREGKTSGPPRPRKYSTNTGDEHHGPYGSPYAPQSSMSPYGSPHVAPAAPGGRYSPNPARTAELPFVPPGGKYSPNPARAAELPFNPPGGRYSPNPRPTDLPPFNPPAGVNPTYKGSASSTRIGDPFQSTIPYGAPVGGQPQVYPRGHILEGQPIHPRSRASSPMPGPPTGISPYSQSYPDPAGKVHSHSPRLPPSPHIGGALPRTHGGPAPVQQLSPPEGFSRPVNPQLPYTPFDTTRIQAMDKFLRPNIPRMPAVLKSHDVTFEDWQRLMSDLSLAWAGRLPVPIDDHSGQPPRRTTLVADLVDLWNTSFFFSRAIEVVLYKGYERRSGPKVGTFDELPDEEDSDFSESDEDEDDESDLEDYVARKKLDPEIIARRRREAQYEKRKAKGKKTKRRAQEREKIYALYLTYVPFNRAAYAAGGIPGGYPPVAYAPPGGGYNRPGGY